MSEPKPIQLGLCCMNTQLRGLKPPVYCSRRIIVRIIDEKGIEELKRRILLNLEDLYKMLVWNEENGIRVFRLSSELFPLSKIDLSEENLKAKSKINKVFEAHREDFAKRVIPVYISLRKK